MGNTYINSGDYRGKLFNHYGLCEDKNMVVHHIDMNRKNNKISNLILLPDKLHRRYHKVLRNLGGNDEGLVDMRINANNVFAISKKTGYLSEYAKIQAEMEIWFALKECRDWLACVSGKMKECL